MADMIAVWVSLKYFVLCKEWVLRFARTKGNRCCATGRRVVAPNKLWRVKLSKTASSCWHFLDQLTFWRANEAFKATLNAPSVADDKMTVVVFLWRAESVHGFEVLELIPVTSKPFLLITCQYIMTETDGEITQLCCLGQKQAEMTIWGKIFFF